MREYLKRHLENKLRKRKRLPRFPRLMPPVSLERQYAKALLKVITAAREKIEQRVIPMIPALVAQADQSKPKGAMPKQDTWSDDIRDSLLKAKESFTREYNDDEKRRLARQYGMSVDEFNLMSLNRGFARVVGIDLFGDDIWLADELAAFTAENVGLITSLSDNYFADAEKTIFNGFRQGLRYEEIQSDLEDRFGVAENRARLIARDQVGKLNGQLTKLRQTDLGITGYIWRTSMDERVRGAPDGLYPNADPSHYDREGKKFTWDDPPEDGNPGQPIQCRCWAEPDFSSVLDNEES